MTFNPLDYPIIWSRPPWVAESHEAEHQAFGQLIVELARPSRVADVGSDSGVFFTALCHAVEQLSLEADCLALLRTEGARPEIVRELTEFHAARFGFSRIRSLPDEPTEATRSIDLLSLHPPDQTEVDGIEDWIAAARTWLDRLGPNAVVLCHGANTTSVTSPWSDLIRELDSAHPSLKLLHGEGLQAFVVGTDVPPGLRALLDLYEDREALVRSFFEELGAARRLEAGLHRWEREVEAVGTQRRAAEARVDQTTTEMNEVLVQREVLRRELVVLSEERDRAEMRARSTAETLSSIEQSAGWRALRRYRQVVERTLPHGSRRRTVYGAAISALRRAMGSGRYGPSMVPEAETAELDRSLAPMVFPATENALVSVVIPTFNQPVFTYNTIRALIPAALVTPLEVIVVDDASTDETHAMLQTIEGIHVITNQQNSGFSESSNAGMKAARGEYILLLNNDALVREGAIKAMLGVMEADSRVGAVGAKLVYPDGRLQEAGGIIWRDGTGMNFGRLDDPGRARYNYLREVDYCSASCLLVRADLIAKLGGFDPRFAPAYYEDTDLAFSLRELGYKVMYQPMAEVIHYEGVSHGYDETKGIKRFQEINRHKFVDKWESVLAGHAPSSASPTSAKDRLYPSVVFVADTWVPSPDRDSGSHRMFHILRLLAQTGRKIVFLPFDRNLRQPYARSLQQLGIEVLDAGENLRDHLTAVADRLEAAILSRPHVASDLLPLVRKVAPRAQILYDTVDLHYVRMNREADLRNSRIGRLRAAQMRRRELELARQSDGVIVVSEPEQQTLRSELGDHSTYVIPNIHATRRFEKPFGERDGLLFVGGFLHPPNADAVVHFVRDILPIVRRTLPDITLRVVGANAPSRVLQLAGRGVEIMGWVPDLEPYLRDSRLFVAPLRFGAGLKGKVGEAFAAGLPGVMTPVAAEGFHLDEIRSHVVADDAARFAEAVTRLYTDAELWKKVADAGAQIVHAMCSDTVVGEQLERALVRTAASRV